MRRARPGTPHRTPDTVTVHSMGGLGNQLFIYATGLAAAYSSGSRLRVDVGQHRARHDRPSNLESLGFPADYVDLGLGPPTATPRLTRMRSHVPAVPQGCTFRERGFTFQPAVLSQRGGSCLFGYFQSWRYLEKVEADIRRQFDLLWRDRAERLREAASAISRDAGSIVLHVRRGDYLQADAVSYHGLAGGRYYRSALMTLRRMGFDGPVYVFSDDVDTALYELRSQLPDTELRRTPGVSCDAVDELLVMSQARALVTANSSFSWWAGWLGEAPGRPVIAPRPWFDDSAVDTRDLLLPDWLTLERRDLI